MHAMKVKNKFNYLHMLDSKACNLSLVLMGKHIHQVHKFTHPHFIQKKFY